jgi:hypothetical protein
MKSGVTSSRTRARVGFSVLMVGAGVAAQAGCGGRYEISAGSAGSAGTGASVMGRAGDPDVIVTQPGDPAGAPSLGGSFGVAGAPVLIGGSSGIAGAPVPVGGSFGAGGGAPLPAGGSSGVAGATMNPIGGLNELCYPDGSCDPGLLCESNARCLPIRGPGSPSVCDGIGTRVLDASNALIDNFDSLIMSPYWSAFADLGAPGVDAADNTLSVTLTVPGAVGTRYGLEYLGKGANPVSKPPGFGVGAVFNVAIDPRAGVYCADISAFDGISFWAKTGVSDAVFDVNFVLPATNAASSDPTLGGGDCVTGCYNHPRKRVALTGSWAQYAILFADAASGSAKVKILIQELGWFSPDANWDFSLDEITFYKGTPPPGAVADPTTM